VDEGWDFDVPTRPATPATVAALEAPAVVEPPRPSRATISPVPDATAVAASADRLLGGLRALEATTSRDGVIDAALAFVAVAAPRVGFAARKGDALASYRGPGAALGAELALDDGAIATALVAGTPWRGEPSHLEARFLGSFLAGPVGVAAAVPVIVREKLVGAFFAEVTPALVDEHVAVVAKGAAQALERVLKAGKR
jgi:hypothetical protein